MESQAPAWMKFVSGGVAGMGATMVVQPLDLLKNRMQMSGKGGTARVHKTSFHAFMSVVKNEGIAGVYTGLSAGLFRQATYTMSRLGIYNVLFSNYVELHDGAQPPFYLKAAMAMTAGACGAVIGTPAEVALVRMTSDGQKPPEMRHNYKSVFNALSRIVREEGILTLWRGTTPTVARAVVLNAAQLSSYSQAKETLKLYTSLQDGIPLHFVASMCSGLLSTVVSMPIDICKTRLQNMQGNEYRGFADVFVKAVRQEGVFSLWKGFSPYYARLGPHTVITFILLEQISKYLPVK